MLIFGEGTKWALMTIKEAEKQGYGCESCLAIIAEAKKMRRRVLGTQTLLIEPKWEIVAIWGTKGTKVDE